MKSAIFLVSVLLSLPQVGAAQEAMSGSRSHTVTSGETLGGIAERYLGSAGEWRAIFDANRDRLSNPDLIRPGMELVIPGESEAAVANVLGFQAGGSALTSATLGSYEARRGQLEYAPFGTSTADEIPIDARTVFYDPAGVNAGSAVIVPRLEDAPALPESSFHTAAWLVPENDLSDRIGEIVGLAISGDRPASAGALLPGDEVRIRIDGGIVPQVGDEFLAYGFHRQIPEVGGVAVPAGRLSITGNSGVVTTARIIEMYDPIRIGDSLARFDEFPLAVGVHPAPTTNGGEARVIAFDALQELYLPGNFAFLDRGSESGIAVGDEMVAVADEAAGPDGGVARFQVVRVRPGGATVRLVSVETTVPLRTGLRLITDRKMP